MDSIDRHFQNLKTTVMNFRMPLNSQGDALSSIGTKIKPITKDNVLYYYMPIQGLLSYSALSINVMNPSLVTRLFPRCDVTNILLLNSFTGAALWLWKRPHVSATAPSRRFPWVFVGSSMFILGSILMWAILRSAVGRRPILSTALGLTSGGAMTYSAIDYFNFLDKDIELMDDLADVTNNSDENNYNDDYS